MHDALTADDYTFTMFWNAVRAAELRARWRGCRQRVTVLPLDDPLRQALVNYRVSDADPS